MKTYQLGDEVLVHAFGSFYPGRVVKVGKGDRLHVQYATGTGAEHVKTVRSNAVLPIDAPKPRGRLDAPRAREYVASYWAGTLEAPPYKDGDYVEAAGGDIWPFKLNEVLVIMECKLGTRGKWKGKWIVYAVAANRTMGGWIEARQVEPYGPTPMDTAEDR